MFKTLIIFDIGREMVEVMMGKKQSVFFFEKVWFWSIIFQLSKQKIGEGNNTIVMIQMLNKMDPSSQHKFSGYVNENAGRGLHHDINFKYFLVCYGRI